MIDSGQMRRYLCVVLLAGCGFSPGVPTGETPSDGGSTDSKVLEDGGMVVPPPDARQCWSVPEIELDICLLAPPSGTVTVPTGDAVVVDTDQKGVDPLQCKALAPGSSDVCVIAGESIVIPAGALLAATGDRPLVLLGATSIAIAGVLDVASHRGGLRGPASGQPGCDNGQNPTAAGGGQGGSFGGKGGNGGAHDEDEQTGGRAGEPLTVSTLRGGCPGAAGSSNTAAGNPGGHGGGAVALITNSLDLAATSRINASGAGGPGGRPGRMGGSGGGSGGMIVLAAGTITGTAGAQVFANGGRGGGGSSPSTAGSDGNDPQSASSSGTGGDGAGDGGDGGRGFPSSQRNGETADDEEGGGGGGGGGGGAGIIKVFSTSSEPEVTFSPLPS